MSQDNGNDTGGNNTKKIGAWVKLAASIITLILLIGGVIWGMDNTFAKKKEVAEKFVLAEEQTVKTFQAVQIQIQQITKQQDIKFYQRELKHLNEEHIKYEKLINKYPDNNVLKEERSRIVESKKKIQQKLDKLME